MKLFVERPSGPLTGEVWVPPSKYHAHRALMLASLAPGTSRIVGRSDALHIKATIGVLRALGTAIEADGDELIVTGGPYRAARTSVSAGSSGTTLYFMIGLAALADVPITLTAQKYFRRRPVGPLLDALTAMGVRLTSERGCPPIVVSPGRPRGGRIVIPGILSQWISALLLLAPFAVETTVIEVAGELNERGYIALTVQMMQAFGLHVHVADDWRRFEIEPGQRARATTIVLPPDIGSAAFGLAATALHPSDVLFHRLERMPGEPLDHPEGAFLEIVREMGLPLQYDADARAMRVEHDGVELRGVTADCRHMPDVLPVLTVLGTFARGKTIVENIAHARLKESDRVAAMMQLNGMGGRIELGANRLVVHGVGRLRAASLSSFNDHRILMALAVAASCAEGRSSLSYPTAYRISYPQFFDAMRGIGIPLAIGAAAPAPASAGPAMHRTLDDCVRAQALAHPNAPAVVEVGDVPDRVLTWSQLREQADRIATLLLRLGVQPGERVAYQLPNTLEFVAITLAVLRIGAVCCPLMPIFRERELAFALQRSRARVLFVPAEFRGRRYAAEVASLRVEHVLVVDELAATLAPIEPDRAALDARRADPSATAQLLFTSGTSGEPKGVLHRNDVLMRAAVMEIEHLSLGAQDRIFVPSPLAHQTGFLYGMWLALVLGVPHIVQPEWNANVALRALDTWDATFVQAATPFLMDLVTAVEAGAKPPAALRIFVATGAAVPRSLAERATRILGAAVCGAWGTTESCLGSLSAPGDEPVRVWGTDGRALRAIGLRIRDDRGGLLPAGSEGHFEVLSPTMFEGYLDHPEWTAEAYTADGWFRTGDLGVIDATGYVHITGRIRDVINRGGEKIPVAEVEQILARHPAVADVAVVAMPDARLGERACAFVVLRPEAAFGFALMREFLDGERMAKPYWPERLEIVAALPRTPSGKIQKYVLRERARSLAPVELVKAGGP